MHSNAFNISATPDCVTKSFKQIQSTDAQNSQNTH